MSSLRITRLPKKVLDPALFTSDQELVAEFREKLISETHQFAGELGLTPDDILGIYIVGSSVGWSWYPRADVDVQVLVDWEKTPRLLGPTVWEAVYDGKRVEKPVTYFFTKQLSPARNVYDVLVQEFVIPPVEQLDEISEETIALAKKWMERIAVALGELRLDIYSYRSAKEDYEMELLYGNAETIEASSHDLKKSQAEIEKDIHLLKLDYKLIATFRGFFGDDFWSSVGNVTSKSIEYASYKNTIKEISESYKKFREGAISFEEMLDEIEEVIE